MTDTQQVTPKGTTDPFDSQYDGGGDFEDIPEDTYCFELSNISKFNRDKNGTLRAEFELTIKGVTDGQNGLRESDYDTRKVWENGGALEGEQIEYFVAKLLRAFRERNPQKAEYIDNVPFLGDGKLIEIVVPEGGESTWEEYLTPFVGLDVIISLKINKAGSAEGYGTKYYKNFPKDQSAGLLGASEPPPVDTDDLPF